MNLKALPAALAALLLAGPLAAPAQNVFGPAPEFTARAVYRVSPETADPALKSADSHDSVALMPEGIPRPELFLWLPGTGGHPEGAGWMLNTAVQGGYRTIGLEYNTQGMVETLCRTTHDPECPTRMRQERFTGGVARAVVPNTPAEGIETRLTMLLRALAAQHPAEGWGAYLDGGHPAWSKIVVAGHSQGAAMAAFIAKQRTVARVVMFSGGADGDGLIANTRTWSSWLAAPAKTPMNRWFAEYSDKEHLADFQPAAYRDQLKIPADHILVFSLDLPTSTLARQVEAHASVVRDPRYLPQWKWMDGLTSVKPE